MNELCHKSCTKFLFHMMGATSVLNLASNTCLFFLSVQTSHKGPAFEAQPASESKPKTSPFHRYELFSMAVIVTISFRSATILLQRLRTKYSAMSILSNQVPVSTPRPCLFLSPLSASAPANLRHSLHSTPYSSLPTKICIRAHSKPAAATPAAATTKLPTIPFLPASDAAIVGIAVAIAAAALDAVAAAAALLIDMAAVSGWQ